MHVRLGRLHRWSLNGRSSESERSDRRWPSLLPIMSRGEEAETSETGCSECPGRWIETAHCCAANRSRAIHRSREAATERAALCCTHPAARKETAEQPRRRETECASEIAAHSRIEPRAVRRHASRQARVAILAGVMNAQHDAAKPR